LTNYQIANSELTHEANHSDVTHHEGGAGHHASTGTEISLGQHWMQTTPVGTIHMDTVLYSSLVMAALVVIFAGLAKTVKAQPVESGNGLGMLVESVVTFCSTIIKDFIGEETAPYLWYIGSVFTFILTANWLSLLPWRAWELTIGEPIAKLIGAPHPIVYEAPTADLNTTSALAILSLVLYWVFGIQKNGIGGFLGHHWFAKPIALFPLRMLEDITRPVSLSLRLFANMTAGHVVGLVLLTLTYFVVPAVLLPLELFVGAVQAFIFATLTASYIGGAVAEHH
jgi:F-type H+-transporting ATPase subunit a